MELSVSYQNYREWTGLDSLIHKAWINAEGKYHKEDGPAHIIYYSDGLIFEEFLISLFVGVISLSLMLL
jgi:hypothetical protein